MAETLRSAWPSGFSGRLVRVLALATLATSSLYLVLHTLHWPMMLDAQVMHYVNFLIDHGFAPYRQIGDLNMPGAYIMERFSMVVFGPGDVAYRVYDFFLLGMMTLAMVVIARPYEWVAGLFAGVLFVMIHATDGPRGTGQRDEVMAVLTIIGYAFLFMAVRRASPRLMALGAFFFEMAAIVKPTVAPLGVLIVVLGILVLRHRGQRPWRFLVYGGIGGVVPPIIFVCYLLHYHAIRDFLALNASITAYYAQLDRLPFIVLLRESLPRPMRLLVPFGLVAAGLNFSSPEGRNWERWALLIGVAFGAFSYFIQGKGFYYQRYPLIAMTLLWFAVELAVALRRPGFSRVIGAAGLAFGIFGLVPWFTQQARTVFFSNIFTQTLESDLRRIGPDRLQHNVQCLDMVDGCMNALYHLDIVQQTGLTGDNILFAPQRDAALPVVRKTRQAFWNTLTGRPPDVIVLSDEKFLDNASFDKLDRWPEFKQYLITNYDLYTVRDFRFISVAYRIYVRKGSMPDLPPSLPVRIPTSVPPNTHS